MSLILAVKLGAATLLRFETIELLRLSPCGSCVLHRFDTLSDLLIMALCTNPPRPFVGEVDRVRSGDIRRWVGDAGTGSSVDVSVWDGSSFGASDNVTGEPSPVAGDTDETLENRLWKLLSPIVEAVLGGEGEASPAPSTRSGSTVESRLSPGS